jgi:hypothetical protein
MNELKFSVTIFYFIDAWPFSEIISKYSSNQNDAGVLIFPTKLTTWDNTFFLIILTNV